MRPIPTTESQETPQAHSVQRLVIPKRTLCRFSCGAASAVATKIALSQYPDAQIYYTDPGSEHEDNIRFREDCERWFGRKVNVLRSKKYKDTWDVFERRKFIRSQGAAPCTSELKRIPGDSVWQLGDREIFGYTTEERDRVERWKGNNNERIIECPLIERELTKADCLAIIEGAGIALPMMYRLGFRNNNCIACVKARDNLDYWRRTRKHFPQEFLRMSQLERKLGFSINRVTRNGERIPIFLDEIPAGGPTGPDPEISCGLFCMAESTALIGDNDKALPRGGAQETHE